MENKTQDYQSEILAIIRGNTSPGVMRNKTWRIIMKMTWQMYFPS